MRVSLVVFIRFLAPPLAQDFGAFQAASGAPEAPAQGEAQADAAQASADPDSEKEKEPEKKEPETKEKTVEDILGEFAFVQPVAPRARAASTAASGAGEASSSAASAADSAAAGGPERAAADERKHAAKVGRTIVARELAPFGLSHRIASDTSVYTPPTLMFIPSFHFPRFINYYY